MPILSIQSWVAYGHVGNAAAVLPLQRLGFEVWAVNTVQFSNHTGYGAWRGKVFPAEDVAEVIAGIADRGVLDQTEAVLTGYLGSRELGEVALDAVARVLRAAGGREVPGRQPEPRLPPVTYMDTGGRNGMKYESVALVSVGAGWLAGNLLWWASRALGAPQTTDACWLAGIGGLVLTWAWLGRRPAGRKD